jgi:hypothetical protein
VANPFQYKLEFIYDDSSPYDSSVFIQMRDNPPIYQEHITKEDYDVLPDEMKHEFLTTIIETAGVTEMSTKAYRVWIMKSPVFNWEEILDPLLHYFMTFYQYDSLKALPGSGNLDGTGFTLNLPANRRQV